MSRRLLALSALALAVFALSACSPADESSSEPSGDNATVGSEDLGLVTSGTLTVATEGTYPPFSYSADGGTGDLVGYDVEIIEAVAEKLGLDIAFQQTQWDAIFAGLDAGRFDVIANQVTINPTREESYLFSIPYTVSPGVIVVSDSDTSITSFADLGGKTVAQSLSSNWADLARENGATVEAVEGWAQAVELLRQGRIDATINDNLTFLEYDKTNAPTGLKVAATTPEAGQQAFAFTKDKQELVAAVDRALEELRADGTLARIGEKYFGEDVSQ